MESNDWLADFPPTHTTWLATCLDDGGPDAMRAARVHLMERYRTPLVAYATHSRISMLDEPDELVHGFFAAKVSEPRFLIDWRASGMPLRRWMLNGLNFHARSVARDRARDAARRERASPESTHARSIEAERAFERAWAVALIETACRAAHAAVTHAKRERAFDCFHRHFFDSVSYASLAVEHGVDETTIASEVRLATRRVRAEAEAILRDEIGSADAQTIAGELARVRELTGWSV